MIEFNIQDILKELPSGIKLVAVSKYHPFSDILTAYQVGQRRFGENRPQEFESKALQLPQDIEWHFIGHLQTNKLKMVLPYASMVESIDSEHLLDSVEFWAASNDKVINVLLELHLGAETTKGGFSQEEIESILTRADSFPHIKFCGLMGMATNTDDESVVRADFARIQTFKNSLCEKFSHLESFKELSIGMSNDWKIAIEYGATIVRIGSAIFGPRQY